MADARALTDRPVLVAPDSFKGTLPRHRGRGRDRPRPGARRAARRPTCARSPTAARARWRCCSPRWAARPRGATVHDPLGREVDAGLRAARGRRHGASSRSRRPAAWRSCARGERDAEAASTRGTGELIVAAVEAGAAGRARRPAAAAPRPTAARARSRRSRTAGGLRGARLVVPVRRAHAVRARRRGLRPAEGRRPGGGQAADQAPERARRDAAARPARRADDRRAPAASPAGCGRQLGAALEPGARVRARRARLRRAHARRPRGHRRRGPDRRADARRARSPARSRRARARPACRATRSSARARSTRFGARILDLQRVLEATDLDAIAAAAASLADVI